MKKLLFSMIDFSLKNTNAKTSFWPLYSSYGVMRTGLKVHYLPQRKRKIDVIFDVLALVFGNVFSTYIPKNK